MLARRQADALAGQRELARLAGLDREAEGGRIGDGVEHAAVGHVDDRGPRPSTSSEGLDAVGVTGDVGELDRLAAAVAAGRAHLDDAAGRLQPHDRLGSCIGSMPVSSSTVVVTIVLDPDIGGYRGGLDQIR